MARIACRKLPTLVTMSYKARRSYWPTWTAGDHRGRLARITYRVTTVIILAESLAGGVLDLARQAPYFPVMLHLGYPPYFADILGMAKLLAVTTLLIPGLPRLKEWAYAGIMINMIGAIASHLAARDNPSNVIAPAAFAAITLVSWQLRQPTKGHSQ